MPSTETSTVIEAPSYSMRSTFPTMQPCSGSHILVKPTFTATTASEPSESPEGLACTEMPHPRSTTVEEPSDDTTLPERILDLPTKLATNGVSGSSKTSAGVPNCMMRPLRMMAMRSAISNASSWSWVTCMHVRPISRAMARSSFLRSILRRASSALSGSSSNRILEPDARARASAMRCCWPPDSCPGSQSAFCSRWTIWSMLLTICLESASGHPLIFGANITLL